MGSSPRGEMVNICTDFNFSNKTSHITNIVKLFLFIYITSPASPASSNISQCNSHASHQCNSHVSHCCPFNLTKKINNKKEGHVATEPLILAFPYPLRHWWRIYMVHPQNVRFTKRQVYKTSGLQNVRSQNVRSSKRPVAKNIHKYSVLVVGGNPQVMLQPCLQAKWWLCFICYLRFFCHMSP